MFLTLSPSGGEGRVRGKVQVMAQDNPTTRLFVPPPLDSAIALGPERAHLLRNVLRLKPGDVVAVFNAVDGEWTARIETLTKTAVSLLREKQRRKPVPERDLWLVFAPIKGDRIDFMAEKATELGVSRLVPVFTQRTVVARVNARRLAATATEAAEQSERLSVPAIDEARDLGAVLAAWPGARRLIVCDETGGGAPLAEFAQAAEVNAPHAIMTGPEGGYAPGELDLMASLPFVTRVGLGPRVLRADTAALAALAIFQSILDARAGAPAPRFAS